jgi:hypothetical protein
MIEQVQALSNVRRISSLGLQSSQGIVSPPA